MNLGASLGTAVIGSILIAALSASVMTGIQDNPDVPEEVKTQASTELSGGVLFVSDTQLQAGLDVAGVDPALADEIVAVNADARIDALRLAFVVATLLAMAALFFTDRLPTSSPGAGRDEEADRASV
jgi:hypothetical protein